MSNKYKEAFKRLSGAEQDIKLMKELVGLATPKRMNYTHLPETRLDPAEEEFDCPNCEMDITNEIYHVDDMQYCPYCGQKLLREWNEIV